MATPAHNRPCTRILISTITCTGALVMLQPQQPCAFACACAYTSTFVFKRTSGTRPCFVPAILILLHSLCVCHRAFAWGCIASLVRIGEGGLVASVWLLCMCVCNCDWVAPCVSVRVLARNTAEASWGYAVLAAVAKNGRSSEIV